MQIPNAPAKVHPKVNIVLSKISSLLQEYHNKSHTGGIKLEINIAQGVPLCVYLIREEKYSLKKF